MMAMDAAAYGGDWPKQPDRLPAPGDEWVHAEGNSYTVVLVTDEPDPEKADKFARVVNYRRTDGSDPRVWPRKLSEFLQRFTFVRAGTEPSVWKVTTKEQKNVWFTEAAFQAEKTAKQGHRVERYALAAPPTAAQGATLTDQQIYDKFDFLEGLVNEQTYCKIADTAIEICHVIRSNLEVK